MPLWMMSLLLAFLNKHNGIMLGNLLLIQSDGILNLKRYSPSSLTTWSLPL